MLWIALAILIVGIFIVQAVNKASENSTRVAEEQVKYSPEYQKKYRGSLEFVDFLELTQDKLEELARLEAQLNSDPLSNQQKGLVTERMREIAKEYRELRRKFDEKYEGSEYNPRTDLSPDDYVQKRYALAQERIEKGPKLGEKTIAMLQGK